MLRFTCSERQIWCNMKKSQDIMKMFSGTSLYFEQMIWDQICPQKVFVIENSKSDHLGTKFQLKLLKLDFQRSTKEICVTCVSPLKIMKNVFCFILKALFLLKIFNILSVLFGNSGKTV